MKASKYNKSRIMKAAHREYNETKGLSGIYTFARALRVAWMKEKRFIEDCRREEEERRAEAEERAELIAKGGNPDAKASFGNVSESLLEAAIDYEKNWNGVSFSTRIQTIKRSINI